MNKKQIKKMADECLGFRIRKLNRVISGYYDEALHPFDIKISQMNIMIMIARMQIARPADLCKYAQINLSTLSRNTERMNKKGWLAYIPAVDGRAHYLELTQKGAAMLEKAYPAWEKAQLKVQKLLGKELTRQLTTLGDQLV